MMTFQRIAIAAVALSGLLAVDWRPAWAWQAALRTGGISGTVTGPDGKALAGAQVSALAVFPPFEALRAPVVSSGVMAYSKSDSSGSFSIGSLMPGKYFVCAAMANTELLDPCQWSSQVSEVTVAAGSVVSCGKVALVQGTTLQIQLNYGPNAQGAAAVASELQHLMVGLNGTGRRVTYNAPLLSETSTGRVHSIVIAYDTPFNLGFHAANLQLQDTKGNALPVGTASIPIRVASGSAAQTVVVNVLGLGIPDLGGTIYVPTTTGKPAMVQVKGK